MDNENIHATSRPHRRPLSVPWSMWLPAFLALQLLIALSPWLWVRVAACVLIWVVIIAGRKALIARVRRLNRDDILSKLP